MPIVSLLVTLIVLALVWWLVSTYLLPLLPEPFRAIVIVILVICLCLWLLSLVGIIPAGTWRLQ